MECGHARIQDLFEKFEGNLVSNAREGRYKPEWTVDVDWAHYLLLRTGLRSDEERRGANEVLLALGVFSLRAAENWMHFSRQMLPMNPAEHTAIPFYFTKKEDAEAYGRLAFFGDNRWGGLYQIGEVISSLKEEALA